MSKTQEIISLFDQYVMPTYGRYPLAFVRGRGTRVWDADGKEYPDFGGGIPVNVLGHAALADALAKQADILVHCSNLYYTEPQGRLAKKLVELVGAAGKCFFCNSGGEANEALYKLARKGQTIEREPRLIHIYEFKMLDFAPPDVRFVVRCTKGTYVRTLCADIGTALGCGASGGDAPAPETPAGQPGEGTP